MISNINANLPLDKAQLIAFFLECVLYGVSALLFLITLWVLFFHRKSERLNKLLFITSSLMMFFGTFHLAIDLVRMLDAFIIQRDAPGGPVAYFTRLFEWSQILKTAIFAIQTVLADSFATYRCWVMWNRSWIVIIPSMSVVGTLIAGIGVVRGCAITKNGDVFASTLSGWITSFFILTFVTNVICTSLIAGRIWITTRKVARFVSQQSLMPVVIVIIESGSIYSASCIILLVLYLLGSNAQYAALDGTFPIISIVFNLMIVRIALGISHGEASRLQFGPSSSGGNSRPLINSEFPMKPMAVTVTQLVTGDRPVNDKERDEDSFMTDGGKERKGRPSWNAV
ncbi:hypothetical protein BYT27DRAFT_7201511 [Phlegmacium glaucopus]|nr:hypothetical protein BYT27DRAFT_7201511 [Phlegmacium glaucopus]